MDTPPLISCGTRKTSSEECSRRELDLIFRKSAVEAKHNPMMVGAQGKTILWQPHNYRLYFNVKGDRKPYSNPTPELRSKYGWKAQNNNSEFNLYDSLNDCRLIVRKNQVEIIVHTGEQWHKIERQDIKEIESRISELEQVLDNKAVLALQNVLADFGGETDYIILRKRNENGVKGDDYIDNIPSDLIIHDTVFKKVYGEKTEFYGLANVKNYLKNRAIESVSGEIANELAELRLSVAPLQTLKLFINKSQDINLFFDLIAKLPREHQVEVFDYAFKLAEVEQNEKA